MLLDNTSSTSPVAAFGQDVRRYLKIMTTIFGREAHRRRHAPFESILSLLEPVSLVALMSLGIYFLERRLGAPPLGDSFVLFITTGSFAKFFLIYVSRRYGGGAARASLRFPIEQRLDHIIAAVVLRIVDYAVMGVIVFGFLYCFVSPLAFPYNFGAIAEAFLILAFLLFGLGTINMILTELFWAWRYVMPSIYRGLIIFSGVFYVPDLLSPDARELLAYNPLVHAIIIFREGFYANHPQLVLDRWYIYSWVIASVLAALVLERITRRTTGG